MYRKRLLARVVLAATAALTVVQPASATTMARPLSIQELVDLSEVIVHGTVADLHSYRTGNHIFTGLTLSVTEFLKGEPSSDTVFIELYGGIYEGIATFPIGAPSFRVGEETVTALGVKRPGVYHVVSLAEGKFSVVRSGDEPPRVQRDIDQIHFLDPAVPSEIPETLEDLRAAIAASLR